MSRTSAANDSSALEAPWRSVEQQLDELVQLAPHAKFSDFYALLLERLGQAVAAGAAVVWIPKSAKDAASDWSLAQSWGKSGPELFPLSSHSKQHASKINRRLAEQPGPMILFGQDDDGLDAGWASALVGVRLDECTVSAIEVFWDSAHRPATQRNIANLLEAFSEAALEFHRNQQLRELRRRLDDDLAVDQFAVTLQRVADDRAVWFTIANEVACIIPSDRVAVLSGEGSWRVKAISHLDTLDRRSAVVRSMERLAAAAAGDSHSVWLDSTTDADSLSAAQQWHRFLEESSTRSAAFIPLLDHATGNNRAGYSRALGALLIERLQEVPFTAGEQRQIERLAEHAGAALSRLFAMRSSSLFVKLRRASTVLYALFVVAALGAAFIPVNFNITARGELQPAVRREIFAPMDGVVKQLHIDDGQTVSVGETLLELTNDELELEVTRIHGELRTARQQLVTVQAARLEPSSTSQIRDQRIQLAAEEERLKEVIQSLDEQHASLLKRQEKLIVRSPIAGRVVTANIEQLLRSRPLRRGQRLLTIADEKQDWILDLRIADQEVGHVLAARERQKELPLEFVVATEPSQMHAAKVEHIADWTELDQEGMPGVRMTARIENAKGLAARPGATATAKIYCGRKPLGYVWLRDLIEFIRVGLWF